MVGGVYRRRLARCGPPGVCLALRARGARHFYDVRRIEDGVVDATEGVAEFVTECVDDVS